MDDRCNDVYNNPLPGWKRPGKYIVRQMPAGRFLVERIEDHVGRVPIGITTTEEKADAIAVNDARKRGVRPVVYPCPFIHDAFCDEGVDL